jgi:hypothetical protein
MGSPPQGQKGEGEMSEPKPLLDQMGAALRLSLADYRTHDCGTIEGRIAVREALARYDRERETKQ